MLKTASFSIYFYVKSIQFAVIFTESEVYFCSKGCECMLRESISNMFNFVQMSLNSKYQRNFNYICTKLSMLDMLSYCIHWHHLVQIKLQILQKLTAKVVSGNRSNLLTQETVIKPQFDQINSLPSTRH